MLEVTYDLKTKALRAWHGNRCPGIQRPGCKIVKLNIAVPTKPIGSYLFNEETQTLIENPTYIKPATVRTLVDRIDDLTERIQILELAR